MQRLPPARTPISHASEAATIVLAGAIAASAVLPSTETERPALLGTAAALIAWGLVWFRGIPRGWFGSARPVVGSTITQLIGAALLAGTGGADSSYFGFYVVPVLTTVFQLQPSRTIVVGALGMLLYWLVFLLTGDPANVAVRDTAVLRSASYAAVATVAWLLTRALVRIQAELVAERSRLGAVIDALKEPVIVTAGGIVESANSAARSRRSYPMPTVRP